MSCSLGLMISIRRTSVAILEDRPHNDDGCDGPASSCEKVAPAPPPDCERLVRWDLAAWVADDVFREN